jgi:UDP-N-acetylmuramoyl-tripeptide--D-alanyl-D-alanine ligase
MKIITSTAAFIMDGKLTGEPQGIFTGVSTDSRDITEGCIFFAVRGPRFDGHGYIAEAFAKGAVCAVADHEGLAALGDGFAPPEGKALIAVEDTRGALCALAAHYRKGFSPVCVAVTGSAGKTTTKEMIASILSTRYKTKKTLGNFNNDIGLPLSIFQLEPNDEALVLEMGMNHANEITALSKVGAPDIAVITHIGDAHIENFANRKGILQAKLEITDGLLPGGTVILNGDDPLLTGPFAGEKVRPFTALYPNAKNIIEAEPHGLHETRCLFRIDGHDIRVTVPLPGGHMVMNALLAASVGINMGLTPYEIARGFDTMDLPDGRLSIINANGMTVINDAYNANPASMREAIKVLLLEQETTRRVCILGDMNELGHVSKERHHALGAFAAEAGIDFLITVGPMSVDTNYGFYGKRKPNQNHLYFPTVDDFLPHVSDLMKPGDVILVKASRGMAFERIVRELTQEEDL